MKNIHIKFLGFVLFSFVVLLSSCQKDWLDRKPLGQYSEEDLVGGSLNGMTLAIYAGLRNEGISALPYLAVHNMRGDDAQKGSDPGDGVDAETYFDNFQYTTDFWLVNNYWTGHYNLINLSNNVINEADSLNLTDEMALINVAEARFLRAFAYFNLVRAFGEVPIIDFRIYTASDAIKPKSSIAEIYQLIDDDLTYAVSQLPVEKDWDGRFPGRAVKGTALAVKAKTHLARRQWSAALNAAEQIITSGEYDLNTPYHEIFTEARENASESVFEIQAFYDQSNTNLGINYAVHQGVRGAGAWNLGWGWNVPNVILENAFEENDPRKDATLLYSGMLNSPYNETLPENVNRPYWNKKVYTNPQIRDRAGNRQGQWFNFRVIRYADVVLMAAEAANETGNSDKALEYLEMVRARARANNTSILPEVTTTDQEELREAIRHERQVELGMENERFFDLVRWEIDIVTLHAAGKTGYQIKHRFLPLPQPEIDKSGGILIQNPDY